MNWVIGESLVGAGGGGLAAKFVTSERGDAPLVGGGDIARTQPPLGRTMTDRYIWMAKDSVRKALMNIEMSFSKQQRTHFRLAVSQI